MNWKYTEVYVIGKDGNQITAHRVDFVNLQETPCGFGDTIQEAIDDLLKQEEND